ncbi:MAG: outer membrane beta-barrel domain-containing protein [Anaeromyxobacter sp.]
MTRPAPAPAARPWRRPASRSASLVLAASALLAALAFAPRPAAAQSKSDAFAGKIPPVSAALFRKAGRWETSLTGNLSLNDAFYNKYFGGLKVGYHFTEYLSLHGTAAGGMTSTTGSTTVCPSNGGCEPASKEQLWQVPGEIDLMSGLEVAWSPVYGKLNMFSEKVGHFDLSLLAGADWISYRRVVSASEAEALAASGGSPGSTSTFGGHVGVGARFWFSEWGAVRAEFKDYIYQVEVPNWQDGGGAYKDLQNQLFLELGVSFFFPFNNRPVQ